VAKLHNDGELADYIAAQDYPGNRLILVEEAIAFPDYRVLVHEGKLICAYKRIPASVIGDGRSTLAQLLTAEEYEIEASSFLESEGWELEEVLPEGQRLSVSAISNLSAGGSGVDVTNEIHHHWVSLAWRSAEQLGLRLCGVDLACADITDPHSDYVIIELNGSPGIRNYTRLGATEAARIDGLFIAELSTSPPPHIEI